jgi:lipopolysaccharide/colanic/teichoic acid biosynthesis glycosyltransferase
MYAGLKRLFDILAAIVWLVLLSPVFLILILVLKFSGEGEVFYRQERIGYGQKPFFIWKFSTMVKNSLSLETGSVTIRNDPRVTPFGRFLRFTKLNEIPQLFNILAGEMSFVGPRPLMKNIYDFYGADLKKQIGSVMPGLTGIGSLVFRDEEGIISRSGKPPVDFYNQEIMPYKGALESWYLGHFSFKTDFLILFLTGWYIFFPHSKLLFKVFPGLPRSKFLEQDLV